MNGNVFWFTGLSGSGKSTLVESIKPNLYTPIVILDGDIVRNGLNKDLGFSIEDRKENIRRIAEVAKIFSNNGIDVMVAFISPTIEIRKMAKTIIGKKFKEIYVKCSYDECKNRDVKGLYAKVERGEIKNFTGKDSPYEAPDYPDLILDTEIFDLKSCILDFLHKFYPHC